MGILLAIFLLLLPGYATAQENGLHAHLTTPARITATPGQIVTAAVSVSNGTDNDLDLSEQISPPPNWHLITPPLRLSIVAW